MKLLGVFQPSRRQQPEIGGDAGGMDPSVRQKQQQRGRRPRLERQNAAKNIDYAAAGDASSDESSRGVGGGLYTTRSLDLPLSLASAGSSYHPGQTSFRIDGSIEGEIDIICRSLGLSGPEDFAIPAADWEARKARCSSDILPRIPHLLRSDRYDPADSNDDVHELTPDLDGEPKQQQQQDHHEVPLLDRFRVGVKVSDDEPKLFSNRSQISTSSTGSGSGGGIRGVRPPLLASPPSISLPVLDKICSTWDILKSLAPEASNVDSGFFRRRKGILCDSENGRQSVAEYGEGAVELNVELEEDREVRLGVTSPDITGSCSFSTSNDDDSSSTTTEGNYISPNGRFKRHIGPWMRGRLLGSGSFGTVYEGISNDGFFFAVKEVSLLDQGSNARQCIHQLEQEISLLGQFEHENIVQYLGTEKEEGKLYIFLELVTQGSLASLYQKYNLRDSQVSAYTRQILNGLRYLHDRSVVHRDIKCANILVDASGSVKLADFGLAKEATKLNMLKSCQGSVYWMAPEVINPRRTYGPAADIWSLGCTVLEMLTRQLPFPNLEWTQALFRIGRGEPPPIPSSLSRDARDFIHQCVQVVPDDRPSASKLLDHPFVKRPLPTLSDSDSSTHGNDRQLLQLTSTGNLL